MTYTVMISEVVFVRLCADTKTLGMEPEVLHMVYSYSPNLSPQ